MMNQRHTLLRVSQTDDGWELRFSNTEALILPQLTAEAMARRILGLPQPGTAAEAAHAVAAAYWNGGTK